MFTSETLAKQNVTGTPTNVSYRFINGIPR